MGLDKMILELILNYGFNFSDIADMKISDIAITYNQQKEENFFEDIKNKLEEIDYNNHVLDLLIKDLKSDLKKNAF